VVSQESLLSQAVIFSADYNVVLPIVFSYFSRNSCVVSGPRAL
jgi:hypothetical protein